MKTNMVLRPAEEFGSVLTGRSVAEEVRRRIEAAVRRGDDVVVDFTGVAAASPSFADELFAKIPNDFLAEGHVRFECLSDDLRTLARIVARRRGLEDVGGIGNS